MNYTFDQAKQAVAERHGYSTWLEMWHKEYPLRQEYYEEVFRLGCNEAVKADRRRIMSDIEHARLIDTHYPDGRVENIEYKDLSLSELIDIINPIPES